ncbi:MAG: hypothetical protein ACI9BW_004035, partial [Gammaproteobacteria bacterium]
RQNLCLLANVESTLNRLGRTLWDLEMGGSVL